MKDQSPKITSNRRFLQSEVGDTCLRLLDCSQGLQCCRDIQQCSPDCQLAKRGQECLQDQKLCALGLYCCNRKCWELGEKCVWEQGQACEPGAGGEWAQANRCADGTRCGEESRVCELIVVEGGEGGNATLGSGGAN